MKSEKKKEFTARVAQANRSELVMIVYEVFFEYTTEARECYKKEDMEQFEIALQRAQRCVLELMETLDFKYSVSKELFTLYVFVNKMLIQSILKKKIETLDDAESVMNTLKDGFEKVKEEDKSKPIMKNIQNIYAGLTYGRNSLNEMCNDVNIPNRGFTA